MLSYLRQKIDWFLRGMPLSPNEQAALIATVPPSPPPAKPSARVSVRKVSAGQLLRPEYADTREGIILRLLMTGYTFTMPELCGALRQHGHQVFAGHEHVSKLRGCLRRSCIELHGKVARVGSKRRVILWLSDDQRQTLREEAAGLGA